MVLNFFLIFWVPTLSYLSLLHEGTSAEFPALGSSHNRPWSGTRVKAALVQRKFEVRRGCDITTQLSALWPSPHPADEPPSVLGKPWQGNQ